MSASNTVKMNAEFISEFAVFGVDLIYGLGTINAC